MNTKIVSWVYSFAGAKMLKAISSTKNC